MAGFVVCHRKVWENPIFKGNAARVGVWLWMLQTAAWKDTTQVVGAEVVAVKRGQLCVSQAQITEATGMPRQPLRTLLTLLEKTGSIAPQPATKSTKGRTLITICKYEDYQGQQPTANQTPTKRQPTKEQGNKETNSLPIGRDGSVVDFQKEIFDRGVAYLARHGVDPKQARAVVGKWRKDHDASEVFDAFAAASKEGVTDPLPWITARLKPKAEAWTPSFDLSKFEDLA